MSDSETQLLCNGYVKITDCVGNVTRTTEYQYFTDYLIDKGKLENISDIHYVFGDFKEAVEMSNFLKEMREGIKE